MKICIEVDGGVVQGVFADEEGKNIQVELIDWDNIRLQVTSDIEADEQRMKTIEEDMNVTYPYLIL
jgi:hypothetical protein